MKKTIFVLLLFLVPSILFSFEMIDIPEITYYRPLKNGEQQEVTVSSFYMAKDDISMTEWFKYLDESSQSVDAFKERFFNDWWECEITAIDMNWPVYGISWIEATRFCNWLSEKDGYEKCYTFKKKNDGMESVSWNTEANGYRLPTLAEWQAVSEIFSGKITEDYMYMTNESIYDRGIWNRHIKNNCIPNSYGVINLMDDVGKFLWDYWNEEFEDEHKKLLNPKGADVFIKPTKSRYDYAVKYYKLSINEIRVSTKACDVSVIKSFVNNESIYEESETNDTISDITIRLCRSKK